MFITYLKLFLNNLDLIKSRLSNEITREKDSCRETHGDRRENELISWHEKGFTLEITS